MVGQKMGSKRIHGMVGLRTEMKLLQIKNSIVHGDIHWIVKVIEVIQQMIYRERGQKYVVCKVMAGCKIQVMM